MKGNNLKSTLMQLEFSLPKQIIISTGIMAFLMLIVYLLNIPNPNMILIAGLVFCSAIFGYGGGVVAAVIMLLYTLFFFSADHSFINFSGENLVKVIVCFIGILLDMQLVCFLKKKELKAFKKVEKLTAELQKENEYLQNISITDALTGIRNRLALRNDYDGFCDKEVTVMMLDLDKFKIINDTCGHKEGDRILQETASLLAEQFGTNCCYRYGGDEFLVISSDLDEEAFRKRVDIIMEKRPELILDHERTRVGFSVGFVHGRLDDHDKLRELFSLADESMYKAKAGGKNCVVTE